MVGAGLLLHGTEVTLLGLPAHPAALHKRTWLGEAGVPVGFKEQPLLLAVCC